MKKLYVRFHSTNFGGDSVKGRSFLRKFISGEANGPVLTPGLTNVSLRKLYDNWHLQDSDTLPLSNPGPLTPFQFHSTNNVDQSYIFSPRLSVTKLLVDRWCELRDYYAIYGGSGYTKTRAIASGLKLHHELELLLHSIIDTTELLARLELITLRRVDAIKLALESIPDADLYEFEAQRLRRFWDNCYGNIKESDLAIEWTEVCSRLFSLFTTSEAREVLVHGYINLQNGTFNTSLSEINDSTSNSDINTSNVLVSGIVDHFKLCNEENPTDLSLIEDINTFIEYEFVHLINNHRIVDLARLFDHLPDLLEKSPFKIVTTDVKTRSFNQIPSQKSVTDGAKFQTFYYRKFLLLLSDNGKEQDFSYYCLLENARKRGIDVDKPINYATIVSLLIKHPTLLYKDFVLLANGDPIGFEPFDDHVAKTTGDEYRLQDFLVEYEMQTPLNTDFNILEDLNSLDDLDYANLLTPELLKTWKTPPSLRYFAARSSQFYHLCSGMISDETTVEYHNSKTGRCFHINKYTYDEVELQSHLERACTFWNGQRLPSYVTDLEKCKYCEFNSKCLIPNHQSPDDLQKKQIGSAIYGFLSTVER